MIAGEIKRFLRDDGSIKVSRAIKSLYFQMQKVFDERKTQNLEPPTIAELAQIFNIDEQEVVFTLESARMPISLYEQFDKDNSKLEVIDRLASEENNEELVSNILIKDLLFYKCNTLLFHFLIFFL
jgi:RNA polymerase sporulation-specific sigma factor